MAITNLSSIFNCFIIHKSKSSWATTLQDSTYYKQNNGSTSTTVLNHTFRNAYLLNHYHTYIYSHQSHSSWLTEDNWILARVLNKSWLAKFAGYFMLTHHLLFFGNYWQKSLSLMMSVFFSNTNFCSRMLEIHFKKP